MVTDLLLVLATSSSLVSMIMLYRLNETQNRVQNIATRVNWITKVIEGRKL
jgi:hypothetical protein